MHLVESYELLMGFVMQLKIESQRYFEQNWIAEKWKLDNYSLMRNLDN